MKLLSYNIWCGMQFEELMDYISQHDDTDVFCFQEIRSSSTIKTMDRGRGNLLEEMMKILPDHNAYFSPFLDVGEERESAFGIAMFVKNEHTVAQYGETIIHREIDGKPQCIQYVKIGDHIISHFHGLWNGKGKTDTEPRILQSQKARELLDSLEGKKIVCGDFNLLPDTKSLAILEEGYINLIKENGITLTRSKHYTKPDRYADYTLVTPDVQVDSFEVPYTEASDHLPMILHFS